MTSINRDVFAMSVNDTSLDFYSILANYTSNLCNILWRCQQICVYRQFNVANFVFCFFFSCFTHCSHWYKTIWYPITTTCKTHFPQPNYCCRWIDLWITEQLTLEFVRYTRWHIVCFYQINIWWITNEPPTLILQPCLKKP